MESGINKKIKVVWLCHFANTEMKEYFNTPQVKEMAPWINNLIELFQERNDIELHIVAPNVFTNKRIDIKIRNIEYHFYPIIPFFIPKRFYNHFHIDVKTNFYFVKRAIPKIINDIAPALIHLHGAENPYYSIGILPIIDHYPTLLTIQGFVRNVSARDILTIKRIKIEEKILKRTKHIGVCTKEMIKIIKELNQRARLYFHDYPKSVNYIKDNNGTSTFDIIFFARVCKDKGIEDLLEALSFIKRIKPDISLHIIGSTSESYLKYLKNMIIHLDLRQNVKFLGFFTTQQEIHKYALNAKLCVLPTYHDTIPGTISESMYMKLPVIAYAVGGIPELNEQGEAIALVEKRNIKQLAETILMMLEDKNKRYAMAEYAYSVVKHRFNNETIVMDIIRAYKTILLEQVA